MRWIRSQDHRASPEPPTYQTTAGPRSDVASLFANTVRLNDHKGCQIFSRQHPGILKEPPTDKYSQSAVRSLLKGDSESRSLALSYIEKGIIMRFIQTTPRFLDQLLVKDREAVERFKKAFERIRGHCEQRAKDQAQQRRQAAALASEQRPGVAVSGRYTEQYSGLVSSEGQFHDVPARMQTLGISERSSDDPGTIPSRGSSRALSRASSRARTYDERFQRLPTLQWPWFIPGRVFAIVAPNDVASQQSRDDHSLKMGKTRSPQGEEVMVKIRRFIIVSPRDGFCLAIPINTYGGMGLRKPGLKASNVEANARIYVEGDQPRWLEGEPHSPKKDIVVRPVSTGGQNRLHPASRLCFERTHSIEYNMAIMKIGTMSETSMPYLLRYWREEMAREFEGGYHGRRPTALK